MRISAVLVSFAFVLSSVALGQNIDSVRKMEASGDIAGARTALARAVESRPGDPAALSAYAAFLESYGDPSSRQAYAKVLTLLRDRKDPAVAAAARRLAALD